MGFVRDRNDPLKLGRVRVFVPSIMSGDDTEEYWLDWCYPKSVGLVVPPMGAPVAVTFEQGYVQHGTYTWGWLAGEDAASSKAPVAGKGDAIDATWLQERTVAAAGSGPPLSATLPADTARTNKPKYPFNKVFQSEGGHVLELDDTQGFARARYYHPSGTTLMVDADGSVHIRSAGAQWFHSGGDIVFALGQGGTFKVLYPGGTGFHSGANGFHVTGHAASILGRTVVQRETDIN